MKTEVSKEEKIVTLKVEIEAEKVDAELNRLFQKYRKEFILPGFRKGKVPPPIIKRYLTDEALYPEVIESLAPPAFTDALRKEKLIPLTTPNFNVEKLEKNKPLVFSAVFEVKPEIEIKDYRGVEVEATAFSVSPEEVEEVLEGLRENCATLTPVTEDRELRAGDYALINFESYHQGKPVPQGKAENFALELKEDKFIPGFMEKLLGMKKGERREFTVLFPKDYPNRDLKGKEVDFKVQLNEIKELEYPELNDELARSVSTFATLGELKEKIEKELTARKQGVQNQEIEEKVLAQLFPQVPTPLPQAFVNYQVDYLIRDLAKQLAWRGESLESFLIKNHLHPDKLKEQLLPRAEHLAKEELVLDAVAKAEKLELAPEEVDKEIEEFASRTKQEARIIKEKMEKDGTLDFFCYSLLKRKVRAFLRENAKVKYRKEEPAPVQVKKSKEKEVKS